MNKEKIIIVGGGLSGPLLAIMLAKRGYAVSLYERRPDMRETEISAGRSINLALSERGITALSKVGMDEVVLESTVAMNGRLIHDLEGNTNLQSYSGREGECINSVSRGELNIKLMDEAEKNGVTIWFDMRCTDVNFKSGEVAFWDEVNNKTVTDNGDVIFGTDGSASAVRNEMMNQGARLRFSYSQSYLEHGYKELTIPAGENGSFKIEKNALHIWPRGGYMMIALPNFDGSFTVTLFLPFKGKNGFDELDSPEKVRAFFEAEFKDVLSVMPTLVDDFFNNPTGSLATVKCYPWQVDGKSLLLGDAAHAVVPFYGQGMNCSFEDCVVLDDFIGQYEGDWTRIFEAYQEHRKKDTDAIANLAVANFFEMRDHVADPVFKRKKQLELMLEQTYPSYFSKYSLVTFKDDVSYAQAETQGKNQDAFLMELCAGVDDVKSLDLEEVYQQVKGLASSHHSS